jgi:hypothetical protein
MRQTIWNQFHHMEDVSNMIFALAALDLPEVQTSGVQVWGRKCWQRIWPNCMLMKGA